MLHRKIQNIHLLLLICPSYSIGVFDFMPRHTNVYPTRQARELIIIFKAVNGPRTIASTKADILLLCRGDAGRGGRWKGIPRLPNANKRDDSTAVWSRASVPLAAQIFVFTLPIGEWDGNIKMEDIRIPMGAVSKEKKKKKQEKGYTSLQATFRHAAKCLQFKKEQNFRLFLSLTLWKFQSNVIQHFVTRFKIFHFSGGKRIQPGILFEVVGKDGGVR